MRAIRAIRKNGARVAFGHQMQAARCSTDSLLRFRSKYWNARLRQQCERRVVERGRARRVRGVAFRNNDHGALRERLEEVARVDVEGVRLGVVHETGAAAGRERRCAERFPDLDVLVFGHSHIPWDTTAPGGLRLLNPGSPTDRRRQPHCTYLTLTVHEGRLDDVTLHRLER